MGTSQLFYRHFVHMNGIHIKPSNRTMEVNASEGLSFGFSWFNGMTEVVCGYFNGKEGAAKLRKPLDLLPR